MSEVAIRLDLRPDHWAIVRDILERHVPDRQVVAFGSRATWTAKDYSDLDLAIMGEKSLTLDVSSALAEAFSESDLPFTVDIVDWASIDETFRNIIRRDGLNVHIPAKGSDATNRLDQSANPLGDYVGLQRGNTYKSALLGQDGPVLLGLASIARNGGFRPDNLKTYGGPSDERMLLEPGDIYVSLKDVTQSADLLGAVARVPDTISQGRLTQDTVKLNFKDEESVKYIYWMLRTPQYRAYCKAHATGTTNLGLPRDDFLSFPIPPPTPVSRTLLQLLESLEDKIDLNRRMNETLEAMARALFKDWFVDFGPTRAKIEGRDAYLAPEIWDLYPDKLDEDGKPEGWEVQSVIDQADWVNGAAYRNMHFSNAADALPVVKIAELKAGVTEKTKRTSTALGDKYRISDRELLFSWSGNPDTSIDAFIWTGGNAWLNQHIFAVRDNGARTPAFLYIMLKWLKPEFSAIARNKQTTGLGHVTKQDLKRMRIHVGAPQLMETFEHLVGPLHARMQENLLENMALANTRNLLLPKLMSGEIRVGDADKIVKELT